MDPVYLHLLLNHIPVLGGIFGVLLLAYAMFRKSDELKNVSLLVLVFSALVTIPVYLTGEPAEEGVEHLAGVSHDLIELHEDAAKIAMIFMMITGAVSLLGLVLMKFKASAAKWLVIAALVAGIVSAGLMSRTASLGGPIRHSEIRTGSAAPQPETRTSDQKQEKTKSDDH